jgi:hypothetical protein
MRVLGVDQTQDELNVVNFHWRAKSLGNTFTSVAPNEYGTHEQRRKTSVHAATQESLCGALRCSTNLTNMLESRVPDGCKQE